MNMNPNTFVKAGACIAITVGAVLFLLAWYCGTIQVNFLSFIPHTTGESLDREIILAGAVTGITLMMAGIITLGVSIFYDIRAMSMRRKQLPNDPSTAKTRLLAAVATCVALLLLAGCKPENTAKTKPNIPPKITNVIIGTDRLVDLNGDSAIDAVTEIHSSHVKWYNPKSKEIVKKQLGIPSTAQEMSGRMIDAGLHAIRGHNMWVNEKSRRQAELSHPKRDGPPPK